MSTVYIGIGSNLGKRKENCLRAIKLLNSNNLKVTKMSSMYETEPWGVKNQPRYINMAVEVKTELSPLTIPNELASWQQIWGYETDASPSCVCVSPDGSYIAVGSSNKVYFLDRDGSLLWSYPTDFPIVGISMTADASRIAASGSKGVVIPDGIVYRLNKQGEFLYSTKSTGVSSVSLSPDGNYFAMTYVHGLGWRARYVFASLNHVSLHSLDS